MQRGERSQHAPLLCVCRKLWPDLLSQGFGSVTYLTIWISSETCIMSPIDTDLFPFKELLRADRSVSKHSFPLQHEIPGGDHRLAAWDEPSDRPEQALKWDTVTIPSTVDLFNTELKPMQLSSCQIKFVIIDPIINNHKDYLLARRNRWSVNMVKFLYFFHLNLYICMNFRLSENK